MTDPAEIQRQIQVASNKFAFVFAEVIAETRDPSIALSAALWALVSIGQGFYGKSPKEMAKIIVDAEAAGAFGGPLKPVSPMPETMQ